MELIDLRFLGFERAIGVYLAETDDGMALLDCGPATTFPVLREGLAERGVELSDIRHLLLSHIHLDHSGAAGTMVRENPDLTVWVSEIGAPHLVEPARLEKSARRIYGEHFDELWGDILPVPRSNIAVAQGDILGWEAFPTPGHASHHVSYLRDGTAFVGDAGGIRPQPSEHVLPVSPPPEVDVEAWHRTIAEIERRSPERLALTHFGVARNAADHLAQLDAELDRWSSLVRDGVGPDEFAAAARNSAGIDADLYAQVVTYDQSWQGLRRYWDKRLGRGEE